MKTPVKASKSLSSSPLVRAILIGSTTLLPTSAHALSPGCTAINSFWNSVPSGYGLARTYAADQFAAGDQVSFTLVDHTVFGPAGAANFILSSVGYRTIYLQYYTSSYNRTKQYVTGSASTIVTSDQLLSNGLIIENGSTNDQASTATVTVRCVNVPPPVPIAAGSSSTVPANRSTDIALSLSGGAATSLTLVRQALHGTASVSGTRISYTPNAGYSGADSFQYSAGNTAGSSATATVQLTVSAPTLGFTPAAGTLPAAPYGQAYSQTIVASGGEGPYGYVVSDGALPDGMTLDTDGTLHGTPSALGRKTFQVRATDKNGASTTANYAIDVTLAVPVAGNGNATVAANSSGQPITLDLSGGAADSVAVSAAPAHGSATASGTGISYTPAAGYSGTDQFSYTAKNAAGISQPGTITVTVSAPTLVFGPAAGTLTGATQGTAYTQAISATQGQAPYRYLVTGGALPAGLILDADGSLHGTPTEVGDFAFTITVTDRNGAAGTAGYSLSVAVAAPVASSGTATVAANSQGTAIEMALAGGAVSTYAITAQPAHGTATLSGSTIHYTPNAGYSGTDSLSYTVSNATGLSQATVSITVSAPALVFGPAVGNLPVATQRSAYSQVIVATGGEGPYRYTVTAGTLPDGLTLAADGTLSGTPSGSGSASFSITATDVHGASGTAAYTLQVDAVPPPVARDPDPLSVAGATTTQTGESARINLGDLVSGDVQNIQIVTQPAHGTVVLTGAAGPKLDGEGRTVAVAAPPVSQMVAVYTPAPGYHGTDSFQFVAVGIGGTSAPATVQINVEGSPPAARNLAANGIDNQTVSVDLTAGRTDGPFTDAAIVDITPAGKATATIVAGGTADARTYRLDIKPAAHFSGTLKLRYTLTNVFGASAPATITLTVAARPDPSADATVRAIADAQSEAVRRFSRAQVDNFMRRAESLHDVECGRSTMGVTLTSTDRVNTQPLPGALPEQRELRADGRADAAPAGGAGSGNGRQCGTGGLGFWAGGSIAIGTRDAVSQRDKISATTSGVSIGADIRLLPGLVLGIGGGFGHDSSTIDGGAGHVVSDSRTVVVYGSATPVAGIFIDGMAARGWLDFDTRRLVAATAGTTRGKRDGDFTTASLSAGTEQVSGLLRWSVYGRAEYLDGTLGAYREKGAGIYDLRFDDRDVRSVLGVAGFRLAWRGKLANGTITPSFRGEWLHEFADASSQALDYADVDGAAFYRFSAQGWGREQFALTPGLDVNLNSGWQFGFELGARIADGERAATSRIQLRKQF